ncbi:MAG: transposase [Chloroflexota bacterium]
MAFLSELVAELDLPPVLADNDEPRGMAPDDPWVILELLLDGYASGVRSVRTLKERLGADVNVMFLAGQVRPDHKTIAKFRGRRLAAFRGLFLEASGRPCRRPRRRAPARVPPSGAASGADPCGEGGS